MVFDTCSLNTQYYKVRIKSKVELSKGKCKPPSHTPLCCSYLKGNLQVILEYGRQLYFTNIYVRVWFFFFLWHSFNFTYPTVNTKSWKETELK